MDDKYLKAMFPELSDETRAQIRHTADLLGPAGHPALEELIRDIRTESRTDGYWDGYASGQDAMREDGVILVTQVTG